jgi:hypothetical protein
LPGQADNFQPVPLEQIGEATHRLPIHLLRPDVLAVAAHAAQLHGLEPGLPNPLQRALQRRFPVAQRPTGDRHPIAPLHRPGGLGRTRRRFDLLLQSRAMSVPLPLQMRPMPVGLPPQPLLVTMSLQVSPMPMGPALKMGAMNMRPLIRRPV